MNNADATLKGVIVRRAWGIVCFPYYLVVVFFLAGSVFGWSAACDQLEQKWKA